MQQHAACGRHTPVDQPAHRAHQVVAIQRGCPQQQGTAGLRIPPHHLAGLLLPGEPCAAARSDRSFTAGAEVTTSVGFDGGTAATFVSGIEGGGAFDETGYVALDSSISSVTGEFSLSYWVKLSVDATTTPRGIFDFSGDGGDGPQ